MARAVSPVGGVHIEADVSGGIFRDGARAATPVGHCYDAVDLLLDNPGVAQKRGGTFWAGPALTGASYSIAASYAPFVTGGKLVSVGDNGHIYTVTSGTTTDLGGSTVTVMRDRPRFRVGGTPLLVFPNGDGSTAPLKYDGTNAPSSLGGTPPAGRYSEVYASRLVLGSTVANPERMYFSPTPDIESTWDTTTSWIDCSTGLITGFAALQTALLVFTETHMERLIGTTPPPGSDMDLKTVMGVGCTDARSIVVLGDQCIFANPEGVYLTNGAAARSLTKDGGIESFWQQLFTSYDVSSWTIAAGMHGNHLFISISDTSGTPVETLLCYVPRRAWSRLSNINAKMFAPSTVAQGQVTGGTELYYADRQAPRVTGMSSIFVPSSSYKNDASGDAVTWSLEYRPVVGGGVGIKAFGMGRLTYDVDSDDGATVAVAIKKGIEADISSTPTESPLAATDGTDRKRFTIAKDAQAVTIALSQSAASNSTSVFALEVEAREYNGVADGTG